MHMCNVCTQFSKSFDWDFFFFSNKSNGKYRTMQLLETQTVPRLVHLKILERPKITICTLLGCIFRFIFLVWFGFWSLLISFFHFRFSFSFRLFSLCRRVICLLVSFHKPVGNLITSTTTTTKKNAKLQVTQMHYDTRHPMRQRQRHTTRERGGWRKRTERPKSH